MDQHKLNSEYSFFNNRAQICVYQMYKNIRNMQAVPWRYISRIIFYDEQNATCCICLSKPTFPRIDKCGHVFCLTCLINLFRHHQTDFVLCPLCKNYELKLSNTKRVKIVKTIQPKAGDRIRLNLLAKGVHNFIPRAAYKLVHFRTNSLPVSLDSGINYSYVSYDQDNFVARCIQRDLQSLKRRRETVSSNNGAEVYADAVRFLNKEVDNFETLYRMVGGRYDSPKKQTGDRFNLLRMEKYKGSFDLFYQCSWKKYVFLESSESQELLSRYMELGRSPPISLHGCVVEVRSETVTSDFVMKTRFSQLPLGASVSWIKLHHGNLELDFLFGKWLKKLRDIKINDIREERKMERLCEEMALRKAQSTTRTSYMPESLKEKMLGHDRPSTTASTSAASSSSSKERSQNSRVRHESFNTCMLGIECVAPDDFYPHAEDCIYYRNLEKENEELALQDQVEPMLNWRDHLQKDDSDNTNEILESSVENIYIDQSRLMSTESLLLSKDVAREPMLLGSAVVNELMLPEEDARVFYADANVETVNCAVFVGMYLVKPKPGSQRAQKKLRRDAVQAKKR